MNLRNANDYTVGLDIGTNSVGWAVLDDDGELFKFKGKNTWGSRLFDSGDTAASTRMARTLRRRYGRRLRRIQDLRSFLYPDIAEVDPEFFIRMSQSSLWSEDRSFDESYVLFNKPDFSEKDYYKRYPTIYHLRLELMNNPAKADIRLVYLALHHMMKYRGNFLIEGNVSAKNANAIVALEDFTSVFSSYCERNDISFDDSVFDTKGMNDIFTNTSSKRRERQEAFSAGLHLDSTQKKIAKQIGDAIFGYAVPFSEMFGCCLESNDKFSLDNEEKVESFISERLPEEDRDLFQSLQALHGSYLLAGILHGSDSLSGSLVDLYGTNKRDLVVLKGLVKKYFQDESTGANQTYYEMFRGPAYADGTYKKSKAKGYTAYILGEIKLDEFYKYLGDAFKDVAFDEQDLKVWNDIASKMDSGRYLKKLRSSDNGAIPHQLHLEEMHKIIENQKVFYPSLAENQERIESLLAFRLPYYVGPLGKENNPNRKKPFSWAVRKEGQEKTAVKPWNFDDVIDRDACAEAFITNLIGDCSYYLGKKVIPKKSLLYSEYCVRQELNTCRVAIDGERFSRMDNETVNLIFDQVFKKRSRVKVDAVREFLLANNYPNTVLKGTQKENEFASSLGSYLDFKKILGRDIESFDDIEMVENLILVVSQMLV